MAEKHFALEDIVELLPNGCTSGHFLIGEGPGATTVFYGKWPPNVLVAAHTHGSDYCEIVLSGKQRVGKKWFGPGDVRVAKGGTYYGPLATGPEGCTIMVIFNGTDWLPHPAQEGNQDGLYVDRWEISSDVVINRASDDYVENSHA